MAASTEFRLVELPTTTLLCSSEAELRRQEAQNAFMTLLFTDPGEKSPAQASADNNRRDTRDTVLAPRLRSQPTTCPRPGKQRQSKLHSRKEEVEASLSPNITCPTSPQSGRGV